MPDIMAMVWVVGVGALLALDRTAAFQTMLSRPLVTGPIIGFLLGQTTTGVVVGGFLELIWLGHLPLGGHLPPNECLAATVAASAAILSTPPGSTPDHQAVVLACLLAPIVAHSASHIERHVRWINGWLVDRARAGIVSGRPRPWALNLAGLGLNFLFSLLFLSLWVPLAIGALLRYRPILPPFVLQALYATYYLWPLVGVIALMGTINARRPHWLWLFGFGLALVLFGL